VAYKVDGKLSRDFPYDIEKGIEPVYKELPGWKTDLTHLTREEQFPKAFSQYVDFLENELQTPIRIISIGPDREQTIIRQ
jgi:adenylosuccinate synthase